ncbi:MAG: hypothetical protein Ct9H300mP12_17400 [Acidimicrobiales bacterium]|nr:MAG: hypothetical protein Ct9H300mP12_17400 [Acidimicrobiales bacterium]
MAVHFAGYLGGGQGHTARPDVRRAHTCFRPPGLYGIYSSPGKRCTRHHTQLVTGVLRKRPVQCRGIRPPLESWLNDRATNETRGSILGAYMVVMMGGTAGGQLLLNLGSADGLEMFVLSSVLISLAVVPVTLSASTSPPMPSTEKMPLRELYQTVPSAVVGIVFCSFVAASASSMAAVFGTTSGMRAGRITLFTTAAVVGAVLLQVPPLGRCPIATHVGQSFLESAVSLVAWP